MSNLLGCPFCGEEANLHPGNYVICCDCSANMGFFESDEEAAEAWNTRQPDPRVAELEANLDMAIMQLDMAIMHIDWREMQLAELQDKCTGLEQRITELEEQLKQWEGEL